MDSNDIIYAWIPRYIRKTGSNEIKYLYVISNYIISFNFTKNPVGYGVSFSGAI